MGLERALLEATLKVAKPEWIENHWCQVVYKLASVAFCIPSLSSCFCFSRVIRQLERRLCFENEAGRSAIRKISEHDESSGKYMVLYVVSFQLDQMRIRISDGWYCMAAGIDGPLKRAIENGKLRVGFKIALCNAVVCRFCFNCGPPSAIWARRSLLTVGNDGFQFPENFFKLHSYRPLGFSTRVPNAAIILSFPSRNLLRWR